MPSLLVFLVAYAGVGGKDASKIDKQVKGLLEERADIGEVSITSKQRHTLVEHGPGAAEIVRDLDVDGLITGEVTRTKRRATLHVVVYDHDGSMIDLVEMPIGKKKTRTLSKGDLESLTDTVVGDIARLAPPPPPEPEPVAQVDDDDVAADADDLPGIAATAPPPRRRGRRDAYLRVAVGAGMRSRMFEPGPAMVLAFRGSAVPAAQVSAELRPIRYLALGARLERTLTMHSELPTESAPSSITDWRAMGALRLPLGKLEVAAVGGVGARDFVIDSAQPAGTPDGHYVYAMAGLRLAARLGPRAELRAFAAFEPVIGGDVAMVDAPTSRRGLEVGGAFEVEVVSHVFALAEVGYQHFRWFWDGGSATDEYPSGTLSLGARY
ncbi:MAG: hypothetical protein H6709_00350 [Kofleriaceae bacterium]|nr:hypothetical protein [Kofleriaceae bacterium]